MSPSTVGIRSSWTCARCGGMATACQIEFATATFELDMPVGWTRGDDGRTVCGRDHDQEQTDGEGLESIGHYIKRRGREAA